jgi:hypothetical protein
VPLVPRTVRRLLPLVLAALIAALMAPSAFGLGLVPVNVLPPSISGSPQPGQTLTCSTGTWLNSPTSYSYTWQSDLSNITGATSSTYTVQNSDVSHSITCSVVASNASGSSLVPAVSAPVVVGLPAAGAPVMTSPPTISPTSPQVGQTLTCSTGTWLNSPTSYAYTWQRNATNIVGATNSTYTVTNSDVNQLITCTVVASNASGPSVPAVSTPVVPISLPGLSTPIDVLPPSIAGSAQQGQTLTCSPGTWLNSPTSYAYTWQRTGINISGATSSTYTLTSSDVNQLITCTVVASNANGSSLPAVSLPVIPVALPTTLIPVLSSLPAILGTAQQGHTLTCSPGTWLNSPTSYAYTWQRNATNISGATSSSYTVTSSDVNQLVTCTVVASNLLGSSVPAVSLPVTPRSASSGGNGKAPVVSSFSLTPRRIVERTKAHHLRTKGATFGYSVSRAATVLITIQKRLKSGRYVKLGRLTATVAAGFHRLKWKVRLHGRLLAAGRYRAVIAAQNANGKSANRSLTFRVIRRRV